MRFFKNILALFTDNFGLKLLALLLAIVIYHVEKSDSSGVTPNTNDRPLFQFRR